MLHEPSTFTVGPLRPAVRAHCAPGLHQEPQHTHAQDQAGEDRGEDLEQRRGDQQGENDYDNDDDEVINKVRTRVVNMDQCSWTWRLKENRRNDTHSAFYR